MKSLIPFLLLTVSLNAQQLVKDTVYLEWRNGKFFEVTESMLDNGQRQLNEKPIGDSLATIKHYVQNTQQTFSDLTEAARVVIQKNYIVQRTNIINELLQSNFNTDLVRISSTTMSEYMLGDYKLRLPEIDVVDAVIDKNLTLTYEDNSMQIIPVTVDYIQIIKDDKVLELYRLGEGQYASLDVQTILIKQK